MEIDQRTAAEFCLVNLRNVVFEIDEERLRRFLATSNKKSFGWAFQVRRENCRCDVVRFASFTIVHVGGITLRVRKISFDVFAVRSRNDTGIVNPIELAPPDAEHGFLRGRPDGPNRDGRYRPLVCSHEG